ncbi:MAG: T9SS type A sorting domain-containing protein [Bacteroidia bacterium]
MKRALLILFTCSLVTIQAQTNISNYTYFDAEPTIAVNPANPNNIVAAWMKSTAAGQITIASAYTNNGGNTWSTPALLPHLTSTFTHADVSLAFNAAGTAYICFIDSKVSVDSGYVMVANSINGGQTWSTPVAVTSARESSDMPVDRPWIAIDNSSGTYGGRIYVTSKSYYAAPLPHFVWMKSSADGGNTWSPVKRIDDSIPADQVTNSMGAICVGSNGNIFIAYASYHTASSVYARMICSRSTDGGAHFTPYPIANFAGNSAVNDTLYHAAYVISANPTKPGNLILSCIDARNGDPDVMSYNTSDTAHTWNSTPVRINDDPVGNGAGQDMCWAGFSSTYYYIAWRDRRNGGTTSTSNFEIYYSGSMDNGSTFCPNHPMSGSPSSPSINLRRGNDFIGLGVSPNSPFFWVDWSDYRTGNTEIFVNNKIIYAACGDGIVENKKNTIQLHCFPNPGDGHVHLVLNLPEAQKVKVEIYDLKWALVKSFMQNGQNGKNDFTLDLSTFPAGNYLLKASTPDGTGQIQFEKQ